MAEPFFRRCQWYGIGVPKNTPHEIVDKLNQEINAALPDPKMKAPLVALQAAAGKQRHSLARCRNGSKFVILASRMTPVVLTQYIYAFWRENLLKL